MIKLNSITNVESEDVQEMLVRYVDLKKQDNAVSGEIKAIGELFKETTDEVILRNSPYLVNRKGRNISFTLERKTRATTDLKALAFACEKAGINVDDYKKTSQVQSLNVSEQKLFD